MKKGYPLKQLKKHMLRACKYSQLDLLEAREKEPSSTPVMTTKFNPQNPNLKGFIQNNWNIIESSTDGAPTLPGADFTKGLSPVSDSNLRLLSQIIGIFYLSPWAQP